MEGLPKVSVKRKGLRHASVNPEEVVWDAYRNDEPVTIITGNRWNKDEQNDGTTEN